MNERTDRLCQRVLDLCRAMPDVIDRDIEVALTEALSATIIRGAPSAADARRRIKSITKLMRSEVRLRTAATW